MKKKSRDELAQQFLLDYLAAGPKPTKQILADAKLAKISRSALFEGKQLIQDLADAGGTNLVVRAERRHDGWYWCLREVVNSRRRSVEYYERAEKSASNE